MSKKDKREREMYIKKERNKRGEKEEKRHLRKREGVCGIGRYKEKMDKERQ